MASAFLWDEIFTEGYIPANRKGDRRHIVSVGLCGFANCMSGNKPPDNFGKGMVAIAENLGIRAATPDSLMAEVDRLMIDEGVISNHKK